MGEDRAKQMAEFLGKCSKKFGDGRVTLASKASATTVRRFSSGVFKLDCALGGGWPFGRIILVHGVESSGKTTVVTKGVAELQNYCSLCHLPQCYCGCADGFVKSRTLWVDQEGTFDEKWAEAVGFDMGVNMLAKTDTAEDACDLITCALEEQAVDAVVLDSIEACVPKGELEKDAGDASQPGEKARLMNKSIRRWNNTLMRLGDRAPTLFLINQEREKIGVMYGNPMTLPGGKAQLFAASIRAQMYRGEVKDLKGVPSALHAMKAVIKKNKTFTSQLEAEFDLVLRDHEGWRKCEFKNAPHLFRACKDHGLLGHDFVLPSVPPIEKHFKLDADVIDWLRTDPMVRAKPVVTAMRHYWDMVMPKCL